MSLKELGVLFVLAMAVQLVAALSLNLLALVPLGLIWIYLLLMTGTYAARDWLRRRPLLHMALYMLALPAMDVFSIGATLSVGEAPLLALRSVVPFLLASIINGGVIEIARMMRVPHEEERGVQTFATLMGPIVAVAVWAMAIMVCMLLTLTAAYRIDWLIGAAVVLGPIALLSLISAVNFARRPTAKRARWLLPVSVLWTLSMYASLGPLPLARR